MKYNREVFKSLAMISQLGISLLAPVVLCAFAGSWMDRRFGWSTTAVWLILGILAGVRNSWILLKTIQNEGGGKKKDD